MTISNSVYLDYQAGSPVDPRIVEDMLPLWHELSGNPHSANHSAGWQADRKVQDAQSQIAELIGADSGEIIFTSGATEANNLAVLGLAMKARGGARDRILVSAVEHKCVLAAARAAEEHFQFRVSTLPVDDAGHLDLAALEQSLDSDVLMVSAMAVNNEVGAVNDVAAISKLTKRHGAVFHCDAAQAPTGTNVQELAEHADLISLSGHKMYGPQGIGALRVSHLLMTLLEPQIYGGGQQGGLRSGTVPMPLAYGMGRSAQLLFEKDAKNERRLVRLLRDEFVDQIQTRCGTVVLNGPNLDGRHPGNANLAFPGISGEDLLLALQPHLAASTGSACTSGMPEPSHVLRAMGISAEHADASIRFSFGRFTSQSDVQQAVSLVCEAYDRLQQL